MKKIKFIPEAAFLWLLLGSAFSYGALDNNQRGITAANKNLFTVPVSSVYTSGMSTVKEENKKNVEMTKKSEQFLPKPKAPVYFGYDFFGQKENTAMPSNEATSLNYLINPGDHVIIDVWGALKLNYELAVASDGFLDIPEAGRLNTNGLTYAELKKRVIGQLSTAYSEYIDPRHPARSKAIVEVTLGRIKGVRIDAIGEVANPGSYLINNSYASVYDALRLAGGVRKEGSLRRILITKANGKKYEFDFYGYYIKGKVNKEAISLQTGDTVFIPMKEKEVVITGEVKRPAVYELIKGETLQNLVDYAGGFNPKANTNIIHLVRNKQNMGRQFIDVDYVKELQNKEKFLVPENGDIFTVGVTPRQRRENFVEIRGDGVKNPGIYQYEKGMVLKDIIAKAGGFQPDVLMSRADLIRTSENFEVTFSTFSLKKAITSVESKKLEPMDKINIYSLYGLKGGEKTVSIYGHVKKPGVYPLSKDMKLSDIIFAVGGFEDSDFKRGTYLEQAHVTRYDRKSGQKKIISFDLGKLIAGDSSQDMQLESGDEIRIYPSEMFQDEKVVEIMGAVRQPGRYEYFENMTLDELINTSGGLSDTAYSQRAEIVKLLTPEPGGKKGESYMKSINYVNIDKAKDFKLTNRDIVYIRKNPDFRPLSRVFVEGLVKFPGEYILKSGGETLSDIIDRAGGILPSGFLEAAELYRNGEKLVVNFRKAVKKPGSKYDPVLKKGDSIIIPEKNFSIQISGAVEMGKINIQYTPGEDADYYAECAGGYRLNADKGRTRIILPSGRSVNAHGLFMDKSVPMGSTIVVPEKAKRPIKGI